MYLVLSLYFGYKIRHRITTLDHVYYLLILDTEDQYLSSTTDMQSDVTVTLPKTGLCILFDMLEKPICCCVGDTDSFIHRCSCSGCLLMAILQLN